MDKTEKHKLAFNTTAILEEEAQERARAEASFKDLQDNNTDEMRNQIMRSVDCKYRQIWLDAFASDPDITDRILALTYK